jgi:hypothetical protein
VAKRQRGTETKETGEGMDFGCEPASISLFAVAKATVAMSPFVVQYLSTMDAFDFPNYKGIIPVPYEGDNAVQ